MPVLRFNDFLMFMPTNGVYITESQHRGLELAVAAMEHKRQDVKIVGLWWLWNRDFEKCQYSTVIPDENLKLKGKDKKLFDEALQRIKTFPASEGQ